MNRIRIALSAAAACVISTLSAVNAQVDLQGVDAPPETIEKLRSILDQAGQTDQPVPTDEYGNPLFSFAWSYENGSSIVDLYCDSDIDLEGNYWLARFNLALAPTNKTTIQKFKVSDNVAPTAPLISVEFANMRAVDIALDLDGNAFVGFVYTGPGGENSNTLRMAKVTATGGIAWNIVYEEPNVALDPIRMVAVDPDGVPFAMGKNWVARLDPVTGGIAWITLLPQSFVTDGAADPPIPRLAIDGSGNVYVAGTIDADADGDGDCVLSMLNGSLGNIEWLRMMTLDVPTEQEEDRFWDIGVNPVTRNVVVFYATLAIDYPTVNNKRWVIQQFDSAGNQRHFYSGARNIDQWNNVTGDMEISPTGKMGFASEIWNDGTSSRRTIELHTVPADPAIFFNEHYIGNFPLTFEESQNVSLRYPKVAFDRLGNLYCVALDFSTFGGAQFRQYFLAKMVNGPNAILEEAWKTVVANPDPLALGAESLRVDAGANVFVAGQLARSNNTRPLYIDKFTQPFVSVPTVQTASADLQFENRSIWAPGAGNLVSQDDFFTVSWTDEGVDEGDSVDVPLLGTFGGSFVFKTSGSLTGGYKAEVNGGTVDIHMPIEATFIVPSSEKFGGGGSPVTVVTQWEASDAARMTSCFTPSLNAGLTAGGNFSVRAGASLIAFSESIFDLIFFDFSRTFPLDYIPQLNLLDLLSRLGFPVPGEWIEFEFLDLFEGAFRTPVMMAQGRYNEETHQFTTTANDRFFNFAVNITEGVARALGATSQFEFEYPPDEEPGSGGNGGNGGGGNGGNGGGNGNGEEEEPDEEDFGIRGEGSAFQLYARVDLALQQDLAVTVNPPLVRYTFSDGVPTQTVPLGQNLNFTLPSGWDGELIITPTIDTAATFTNETDLQFIPGIKWKTLEVGASIFAYGYDLLPLGSLCVLCFDWDLSEILEALGVSNAAQYTNFSLNLFPLRAPTLPGQTPGPGVFANSWDIPFQQVPLPPLRIVQSGSIEPHLIAASRSSMSMLIYDQTSPTVGSFNVAANGRTKLLLYGYRFCNQPTPSSPCDVAPQVYIRHYGREEQLTSTAINASTLLVEVPNRFRLLPGVAKIWVVANGRTTETIDMPIEYPIPRLDAVNPNLWAADPGLADLPISVIDAKTFRGSDTFIARRDYYIKMRNSLWNATTAGGISATAYFPGFNWNQMPGFPSVLWGGRESGVPLPRFIQPVDNGIHNVRLADGNYDRAQMVPVTLCNPGPGGGYSNTINLTIAAPIPVVNGVSPSELSPSDIEYDEQGQPQPIELTISGPRDVPQFFGYEEPKYGNFNAESVVRFNGTPLQTTFISSSRLLAKLPPNLVTTGNHTITVYTPGNGTQYFEELWTDANGDGKRDGKPVFQGLVDSGGESVGMLFPIRYRQPDVSQLSPPTSVIDNLAFNLKTPTPKNPQGLNFTLQGQDFRPGAIVYFNNQPRLTTFVDKTILRARLLPQDVDVIGQFPITVRNPAPDFQVSQPIIFTVKPPDPRLKVKLQQTQAASLQRGP